MGYANDLLAMQMEQEQSQLCRTASMRVAAQELTLSHAWFHVALLPVCTCCSFVLDGTPYASPDFFGLVNTRVNDQ